MLQRNNLIYTGGTPRIPLGAHLMIGYKGPNGAPVDKDRFHIGNPYADGKGREARRAFHPAFSAFNGAGAYPPKLPEGASLEAETEYRKAWAKAEAERAKCRIIRGIIVHSRQRDAHASALRAQKLPSRNGAAAVAHPQGAPACEGDGKRALRYAASSGAYIEIPCACRQCPYMVARDCRQHTRLLFQLRWAAGSPLPTPLCEFSSLGWETGANVDGLFDWVTNQARMLGITGDIDFFGLPFMLAIYHKTNPAERSRYPVVSVTPDFPEGMTLQEWLYKKATARAEFAANAEYMALPELSSDEDLAANLSTLSSSRGES